MKEKLIIYFSDERNHLIDDPTEIQSWIIFCKEENIPYTLI
jgi:hypothetical protein